MDNKVLLICRVNHSHVSYFQKQQLNNLGKLSMTNEISKKFSINQKATDNEILQFICIYNGKNAYLNIYRQK